MSRRRPRRGVPTPPAPSPRRLYYSLELGLLEGLVEAGAWVQVTVDSLLGNFGPNAREAGEAVLRTYPLAVLASAAHNLGRCSGIAAGYEWVRTHLGQERHDDLRARADLILNRLTAAAE